MRGVYRRTRYTRRVAEFVGLLVSLILVVFVLMPVLTFIRMGRISRELEELSERVTTLERVRASSTSPFAPSHAAGVGGDRFSSATEPANVGAFIQSPSTEPTSEGHTGGASSSVAWVPPFPPAGGPAVGRVGSDAAHTAVAEAATPDLEERLGGRGLLYTGIVVLLLGVSFFLKYAFENAWINETGRVVFGVVAGLALVGGGLRLASQGLAVFGQALAGTGLAILYLAVYAALDFYGLINETTAFLLMTVVTIGAGAMAHQQRAQALAFIAVGGGFLTPLLIGGDENAQLRLFSYVALLVGGTMVLSLRHRWLALNALSYIATLGVVVAWASSFYTDAQWLRTLLFLTLFCVLFLVILRETNRNKGVTARLVTTLLSTAPIFYHLAAIVISAAHPPAIHVYLIAFTATGLWLTADPHRPILRLLVLLGADVAMFGALTLPEGISWAAPNVVTIVAVAALHLMAILDRVLRQEQPLAASELVTLHLTGLGLFALLYAALQPTYPEFRGALAALLALGAVGLWRLLLTRDRIAALNAVALSFTLAAMGLAVQFDGPTVIVGWAAEGAAAAWLGVRFRRRAFQLGGAMLWLLAVVRLLDSFSEIPANFTVLANARAVATLFVVVLGYALTCVFSRSEAPEAGRARAGLHVVISFLTLMWVTSEITSFWEVRYLSAQAHLYEQTMLSLAAGLYGALLIMIGMKRGYPPLRYIGMTILAVTVLKVFFYDLWELGGIYRVVGFMAFGALLVLVSYLYQKRRGVTRPSSESPSPSDAAMP